MDCSIDLDPASYSCLVGGGRWVEIVRRYDVYCFRSLAGIFDGMFNALRHNEHHLVCGGMQFVHRWVFSFEYGPYFFVIDFNGIL
jgi:hypothetical protein